MERRDFLRTGAAALMSACWPGQLPAKEPRQPQAGSRFQLKYAPHFGMFRHSAGDELADQLRFAADEGFTAWEDDGLMSRPAEIQHKIARTVNSLGMELGAFKAAPSFAEANSARDRETAWEGVLQEIRTSVDLARRVGAKWITVALGRFDTGCEPDGQMAAGVELLKRCSSILEPHGLVLVVELENGRARHPSLLLPKLPQLDRICRAVGSPSCKMMFDVYHQQVSEGNLIPSLKAAWDQIAYVRYGDNPGRKEPGTGEIDYRRMFAELRAGGYTGVVGMQHGNSQPGPEGERAVIEAYEAAEQA